MYRNVESHFSSLPSIDVPRSTFDRPYSCKTSLNVGDLIPFYFDEVIPGDTFNVRTSKVIRSQTMLTPIMDDIYCDTYYFFCPTRLLWNHFKEFCGENTEGAWAPSREYVIPSISSPKNGFASGTLADYFGYPVGVEWDADDPLAPSALPFRAYGLIWNHFFRDENLQDPLLVPLTDANQTGSNGSGLADVCNGGKPCKANKYHDYFTSVLPSAQKGSPVGIPITIPGFAGGTFPVTTGENPGTSSMPSGLYPVYAWQSSSSALGSDGKFDPSGLNALGRSSGQVTSQPTRADYPWAPANLQTVIPGSSDSEEISFTINQFRLAYVMQCYLERLARGGSRYNEILLSLFGVKAADAVLQDPEYLGGNRIPIHVSETTNTAQSETDFLGDVGAKTITTDISDSFNKSFTEHGYIIGLMCLRYHHSYSQGLNRMYLRKKFVDFYNPMFANLGEVPVYKAEIYANASTIADSTNVFGFQEIFADYRYKPSICTGEMRPGVTNSLAHWHLADYYTSEPFLSSAWIAEDGNIVNRVLAVGSNVSNQFWADIYMDIKATRPMPMYSIPGLEPKY